MGKPRPTPVSPLLPHRGPVIVVDEKYSWRKHVEYPASPSSPFWKSPPSLPSAPPMPSKLKPGKPKPAKCAYYYPDSPLSRNFENWYSPECTFNAPSPWTPDGSRIRHCEDAYYGPPPRLHVDETKLNAYCKKAGRRAYVEEEFYASTEESESKMSRRMRIAREVDEQMRADEEMLKQKKMARRRGQEKAHWEMQVAGEKEMRRENERIAERAHWEWQVAREHTRENKNTWEEKEWKQVRGLKKDEKVRGLGIQGIEHDNWERIPIVRPKREAKPEYGLRHQNPEDYDEWKLEIHNPVKGKDKGDGIIRRPQRWIEVREKAEGKVEVVMVRRRKSRY